MGKKKEKRCVINLMEIGFDSNSQQP